MSSAGGASAAGAAAARQKREQEEEEEMTPPDPASPFEYKIIRSATGAFKDSTKLRAILDEEARAGWELMEKFDDARVRLKRNISWREKDSQLTQDPYRTRIGVSEVTIMIWVLVGVRLFLAGFIIAAILIANRG